MGGDKIRIKDIAILSGVSVGTVDRVLHNRPNVSKEAREKVEKALKEMDYHPNVYASALAYNKSYKFFCIIPKHESEAYWQEIEEGAMGCCEQKRDFLVTLCRKLSYFFKYSLRLSASFSASYIGDYTVCAEIIATVHNRKPTL